MAETAAPTLDPLVIEAMHHFEIGDRAEQLQKMLEPHRTYLGQVSVEGQTGGAWRSHVGPGTDPGRGGLRIYHYGGNPETAGAGADKLAGSMYPKARLRKLANRGGKGVMQLDGTGLTLAGCISAVEQYADLMHNKGFDHHLVDGVAGDIMTNNSLIMDAYTERVAINNPGYRYAVATATGTSLEKMGDEYRFDATGDQLIRAQRKDMMMNGEGRAYVAIQGAGNVGAVAAHSAHASRRDGEPEILVNAISEWDGIVSTDDRRGLRLSRDLSLKLGDVEYHGPKAALIAQEAESDGIGVRLAQETAQRNIFTIPTDYVMPCALPGQITEQTVPLLGARKGIKEGGNNTITRPALQRLREELSNLVYGYGPGEAYNGGGTDVSTIERDKKIESIDLGKNVMPSYAETQKIANDHTDTLMEEITAMQDLMQTSDRALAVSGLFVVRMFPDVLSNSEHQLLRAA